MDTKVQASKPLVLYFHIHQPKRLRRIGFLDIGSGFEYFDEAMNAAIAQKAARECYLPVTAMLRDLCKDLKNVRLTFSISGVALEQFEKYTPEVIDSFRSLVATGCIEMLGETSHHTLASLTPNDEFPNQVREHTTLLEKYFNVRPNIFRNTELIYNNSIGARVAQLGFKGILCDDVDRVLLNKTHNAIYRHPWNRDFKILLRNNSLSDDIGFRFVTAAGKLDLEKYFNAIESSEGIVTLGLDYETFGEHQPASTGIIDFLKGLITKASQSDRIQMMTPTEAFKASNGNEKLDVTDFISWADEAKDISAWLENEIQNEAFMLLQSLEEQVKNSNNHELLDTWRNLQTSDHFYYMSTKNGPDGEVHAHFRPYNSPYEAYINYMNILNDFKLKLQRAQSHDLMESVEYERRHENVPKWAEKAQTDYHELTSR
jgi:alpha-amylase